MNFFRIPPVPPAIFTIVAAVIHGTIWPFEPLTEPWHLISGGIIIAIAVIMFGAALATFRRNSESFDIRKPTQKLVTDGIYATSRNPAYLAMLIAIFGIACAANSLAIMLATIPSFAVFNWYTIPWEEGRLRRTLGAEYISYSDRVRRWL